MFIGCAGSAKSRWSESDHRSCALEHVTLTATRPDTWWFTRIPPIDRRRQIDSTQLLCTVKPVKIQRRSRVARAGKVTDTWRVHRKSRRFSRDTHTHTHTVTFESIFVAFAERRTTGGNTGLYETRYAVHGTRRVILVPFFVYTESSRALAGAGFAERTCPAARTLDA